jgi:radical SAM superfamily enzyme YgiQ (UPF0313 family)
LDYVGRIFRPPSEANSLLLQVSVGCSHNGCTYCDMYSGVSFRTKPWGTVLADIEEAAGVGASVRRVFLCDGDALILPTRKLLRILEAIRTRLPWIERVGVYGDTRSVGRKSVDELIALREAGLGIIYHGAETGSDAVMTRIDKGGTREECLETARRLRAAGLTHSVMVLLGIGGRELSAEHARETASMLSEMAPRYVGALTTTLVPGTLLHGAAERGEFTLPSPFEMLLELRTIVAESQFTHTRFSCNHASNYLPMRMDLPRDRGAVLSALDQVIADRNSDALKPEYLRGL